MEENSKISLSTLLLILCLIIIVIMGVFIYYMYNQNIKLTESSKNYSQLQEQVNTLNQTINNLHKIIDSNNSNNSNNLNTSNNLNNSNTSNTLNTNSNITNDTVSFTNDQVKNTLLNYLELMSNSNVDNLLEELTKKNELNYNPEDDTILNDGTVITKIKFSDYKKAMLNYVSEKEFEKNWNSTKYFGENSNGYLTKVQGGGAGISTYTINNLTKEDDSTYTAETTSIFDEDNTSNTENFTFTVASYNNKCVIDYIS